MKLAWIAFAIVACVAAGCAANVRDGLDYNALSQRVGSPKAGQGRVVVFREKAYGGLFDEGWNVKLDGEALNSLKTGTFAYADRPAGHHELTTDIAFPAQTHLDVTVAAGRTYFYLARPSQRALQINAMAAAGGLTGLIVTSAMTSGAANPGPLDFFPLEDTAARTMMADLRLAETKPASTEPAQTPTQ